VYEGLLRSNLLLPEAATDIMRRENLYSSAIHYLEVSESISNSPTLIQQF
jgi:hypothetical protein